MLRQFHALVFGIAVPEDPGLNVLKCQSMSVLQIACSWSRLVNLSQLLTMTFYRSMLFHPLTQIIICSSLK